MPASQSPGDIMGKWFEDSDNQKWSAFVEELNVKRVKRQMKHNPKIHMPNQHCPKKIQKCPTELHPNKRFQ